MPFYEYQCEKCGHDVEVMQKVSDARLKKCPECGKSSLKRLMSAPVFRLKGSGWYETDFKSDQDNKRNLVDKAEPDAPKEDKPVAAKDDKKADAATPDAAAPVKESKPAADKPAAGAAPAVKTPASSGRKSASRSVSRKTPAARKKAAAKSKSRR